MASWTILEGLVEYTQLLILILGLAAVLAFLGQKFPKPPRPNFVGLVYLGPQGQRITRMQVTADGPLQLLVKGVDRAGNLGDLPAGATVQNTVADTTIASASQSGDGKTVTVTEVKVGNTILNGTATMPDGGTLTGSVTLECVAGAFTSLAYVPAVAAARR